MWAAVVGNIVSFSFKQNYTYKTYFWLSFNIRISGTLNYFLLDVKKDINNGQNWNNLVIPKFSLLHWVLWKWAWRERLYDNDYIKISVFFLFGIWSLEINEYRLDILVRCIWDSTSKTTLQGENSKLSLLNFLKPVTS